MKGTVILQFLILGALFFNQVVMNFVIYFNQDYYQITVNVVNCLLLFNYVLQCLRIYISSIDKKWKYFFQSNLHFLSNYVMAALALYIYIKESLLGGESPRWIAYGSFRFIMQIINYTFLSTKQFINVKTYIIAQISITVWISFIVQGTVSAILEDTPSELAVKNQKLLLAELSMNLAIGKTIMEYLRASFNQMVKDKKDREEKKNKMLLEMTGQLSPKIDDDWNAKL